MLLGSYLRHLHRIERSLAGGFEKVATHHRADPEIADTCVKLARWSAEHVEKLTPHLERFPAPPDPDIKLFLSAMFNGPRSKPIGLLNDLQELLMIVNEAKLGWTLAGQAARALRDKNLLELCTTLPVQSERQALWLETKLKAMSAHTLVVV